MARRNVFTKDDPNAPELEMPAPVIIGDERTYRTALALPATVFYALIDATHPEADIARARAWGLLDDANELTPIGVLVKAGVDQTAVNHKMIAGWREAKNAVTGFVSRRA